MVGSVAAILQAIRGADTPLISAERIRDMLVDSAADISEKWDPGTMRRLNALAAVRYVIPSPTHQSVFVADAEAPTPGGAGHIVAIGINPLTGDRPTPPVNRVIPLSFDRGGVTYRFTSPRSIAMDPAGTWAYAVVSSADGTIGDGIAFINTRAYVVEDFVAFSGALLSQSSTTPRPPPDRTSEGRRTIAVSRDGRVLYAATGLALTIVNLEDRRVVRAFEDLPPAYNTRTDLQLPGSLQSRQQALATALSHPIAGRQPTSLTGLDISSDGRTLYGAISTGGRRRHPVGRPLFDSDWSLRGRQRF